MPPLGGKTPITRPEGQPALASTPIAPTASAGDAELPTAPTTATGPVSTTADDE